MFKQPEPGPGSEPAMGAGQGDGSESAILSWLLGLLLLSLANDENIILGRQLSVQG